MKSIKILQKEIFLHTFSLPCENSRAFLDVQVRQILGDILKLPPHSLEFLSTPQGKPYLNPTQNKLNLAFNLSHSKEKALLGIAIPKSSNPSIQIGVDIQKKRPVDALKIAGRFFHSEEYRHLLSTPYDLREALFFEYWTQKEAYVKCLGEKLGSRLKLPLKEVLKDFKLWHGLEDDFFYAVAIKNRPA